MLPTNVGVYRKVGINSVVLSLPLRFTNNLASKTFLAFMDNSNGREVCVALEV